MSRYKSGQESNRLIGRALNKYGFENFDISILEKVEDYNLIDSREQYWMDYYQSYDLTIGYNVCKIAGSTKGYHHTENDKKRMSEIAKERFRQHPEYIKFGKDNPMYGKHPSQETKNKMSKSRMGNQNAKGKTWTLKQEYIENRRKNMIGNKNCLGRKISEEHRARIIESNHTRKISDATKKKMSESHKGKTAKKVKCVETGIVYNSITKASEAIHKSSSGIIACCKGVQKTCGGYHWKYVD